MFRVPSHAAAMALAVFSVVLGGCRFDVSNVHLGTDAAVPESPDSSVDANTEPTNTFVAYWSFDYDGSDATGNHHGTLVGGATITSGGQGGRAGDALQLPSDGARVDVASPETFDFNSDFTWHAYVKTNDQSGAIFSRNPAGTLWNQGSKALFVRNRDVEWDTGWVGNPGTGIAIDDGEWHQVIVTYVAATDALEIFVDPSVNDVSGSFSGTHDVNRFDEHSHNHLDGFAETGFSIGAANFTGGLSSLDTLIGLIDEVAIFDRALSGDELSHLIVDGPANL